MKSKNDQRLSPAMVEDDATERLKKRARDLGLIVNAGAGPESGAIATQTKTTRRLDPATKREADGKMKGGKK